SQFGLDGALPDFIPEAIEQNHRIAFAEDVLIGLAHSSGIAFEEWDLHVHTLASQELPHRDRRCTLLLVADEVNKPRSVVGARCWMWLTRCRRDGSLQSLQRGVYRCL